MCPSIGVLWVPQQVSDDTIHDQGIDEEPLGELLGTGIVVRGLSHRMTPLEELLLLLITSLLVFFLSLRMLLLVMLYVVISTKRILEVLDVCRLMTLGSDLNLPPKVHTEQAFK